MARQRVALALPWLRNADHVSEQDAPPVLGGRRVGGLGKTRTSMCGEIRNEKDYMLFFHVENQ